ncbi:MAG: DNA-directed RNA polymerase subunit alpha [Caldisericia bacterium]|nr:DNA-directed RNA polymerase subunit alpha [Caldisericia bacterium]
MGFTLDSLRLTVVRDEEKRGEFKIGPLHKGYGITIGNALRRVLLSSIQGTSIVAVHIDGIFHQFTSIPGVLEDGIQIVAQIKKLVLRSQINERKILSVTRKTQGTIYARDLIAPPSIEIVNGDLPIATIVDDDTKFSMTLHTEQGIEYRLADENRDPGYPIGTFPIDSAFCPVTHVQFSIKQAMYNESLNYETLDIIIETNGAITPYQALQYSSQILVDYFSNIMVEKEEVEENVPEILIKDETEEILKRPLEEIITLSVRTGNVFKKANIYTIQDLFSKTRKELLALKNFGTKSLTSTIEELMKLPEIEKLKNRKDLQLMKEIIAGSFFVDDSQEGLIEEEEIPKKVFEAVPGIIKAEVGTQAKKVDIQTVLNTAIEEVAEELEMSEPQFIKLKEKLMVDTVEHLTHLAKEELLTGNNKLSRKNVDLLEEYLKKHGLSFKE